ncbi:MAG: hypothetical protein EHM68_11400 [Lysobacterales bacterium]|nr:MAG: hypothetical protein EHM68_11400 [Xanthomonadales bacterium]
MSIWPGSGESALGVAPRLLLLCAALAAQPAQAPADVLAQAPAAAPLFASDQPMEISITADFPSLCRPRETEECAFTPSRLEYRDESGRKRSIPIQIKIRGGWRSLSQNCSVPLLWVNFESSDVAGTPFEGQSQLPLTTHCGKGFSLEPTVRAIRRSDYEQYLLREFLGHRLYNLITDRSLRVRLLRIAYPKPGSDNSGVGHYAFFSEHFDSLAARLGAERLPRGSFDHTRLDAQSAATLALFQYMIGNTDWSIARERNTMLLRFAGDRQVPVPYDLDMSGLVNAAYAGPAPGLPIDEVRERYFLGYCQPGTEWEPLFEQLAAQQPAIMSMAEGIPGLSRNSRKSAAAFLRGFFEVIASPEQRRDRIVHACQPWPPAATDHTSALESGGR